MRLTMRFNVLVVVPTWWGDLVAVMSSFLDHTPSQRKQVVRIK